MVKRARLLTCIQNFSKKAHDLNNVQKSTSIAPYNKVVHKAPPTKLGVRIASFAKTGDQMTKAMKYFFNTREKMGSEIGCSTFKIDPKRKLGSQFSLSTKQSKAKAPK